MKNLVAKSLSRWFAPAAVALVGAASAVAATEDVSGAHAPFPNFESGPVNSLLVDGDRLYVLNTPDHRVEVYRISSNMASRGTGGGSGTVSTGGFGTAGGTVATVGGLGGGPSSSAGSGTSTLTLLTTIFTGLEPVAMVKHPLDPRLLFVSNHLSDSVSVVDVELGQVVATLPVGDEPQGLAIAQGKLFVAAARGPATPASVGSTDPGVLINHVVSVYQSSPPFAFVKTIPLQGWKPRDVATDGQEIYVIVQNSGNGTTILNENHTRALGLDQVVADSFDGGPFAVNPILVMPELNPLSFARGWYQPFAGRIVNDWEYPSLVADLKDNDLFTIDAATLAVRPSVVHGVGTTLFDVERNPVTGDLWVANTDANNRTRFEPRLRGEAVINQVSVVTPKKRVRQRIEFAPPRLDRDLAQPSVITFLDAPTMSLAYVGAQLSAAVAILDPKSGSFRGTIETGFIPAGLAADPKERLLFVHCRGEKKIRVYDIDRDHREVEQISLSYDPEPLSVTRGRRHLYEARDTAGHGNGRMACATCHIFGHSDGLAWDLGNPEGTLSYFYPDLLDGLASYTGELVVAPSTPFVNPLKGPMVTQSLRGLMSRDQKDDLSLHWRGERRTVHAFDSAYRDLLGGSGITRRDVQEFTTFVRTIRYAPNPYQPKDRQYVGDMALGTQVFGMTPSFQGKPYNVPNGASCIDCHNGDFFSGDDFTGSRPVSSAGSFTQIFQTAQLRMLYEKDFRDLTGFGALHDGAVDGVRGFMDFHVPNGGPPTFPLFTNDDKDHISAFTHAWDHGIAPLVGAQFTMNIATLVDVDKFLDLAEAQARPPISNVDLILKGYRIGADGVLLRRGAHYRLDPTTGQFGYQFDTGDFVDRSVVKLVAQLGIGTFTFTCVPVGMGDRLGVDRDEDGLFDFVEGTLGLDPSNPDTDGDGYLDGMEASLGGDPLLADAQLPDATPPQIIAPLPMEIGPDAATIAFTTDEPALVHVDVGVAPSFVGVGHFAVEGRRQIHDVILSELPGGTDLAYRITALDRDGNASTATGTFKTFPPQFHIADIDLTKSGGGPFLVTATVTVEDANGIGVPGLSITGFFSGDLGGSSFQKLATTDGAGVATFSMSIQPSGPTTIGFSPAYLGSPFSNDTYFVGNGGDTPKFFYDVTENRVHYRTVALP